MVDIIADIVVKVFVLSVISFMLYIAIDEYKMDKENDESIEDIYRLLARAKNDCKKLAPIATSASEYLSRIEKAALEIAESRKPIDTVIVLWWGLDGLRLNENGTTEWISRRKPEPNPDPLLQMAQQAMQLQSDEWMRQRTIESLQCSCIERQEIEKMIWRIRQQQEEISLMTYRDLKGRVCFRDPPAFDTLLREYLKFTGFLN